jgi:hypothetical protein
MATASRKYKIVTKQVPDGVTLELTKTEAIVLLRVLFQVGGHTEQSAQICRLHVEGFRGREYRTR